MNVFELTWLDGDRGTALANPSSVILTKSMAKKYFSQDVLQNKSIIGKHMMLENKEELTVTGIIEDMPGNISLKFDILRPYEFFRTHSTYKSGNWSGNYLGTTFVVLKDGQAVTEIENKIAAWKKKYLKPEDDSRIQYRLQPLKGMHNDEKYGSSPKSYLMPMKMLYAAGSVALFIIIIACANFINLATAQAAGRSKEVGIRKVMGSTTSGLVSQFLNENIILVGFTVIVSLALTQFSVGKVNEVMSLINLKLVFDWSVVVIAIALGCLIVLMACFYPSVVMASFKPLDSLRNRINTVKTGGLSLRRMLIVFQFSIVQVFIIGTLVVAGQINYFNSKDLGFSKKIL
ncbi:MAG: FtsX-like permease family protein [Bacteroidota bacterium]